MAKKPTKNIGNQPDYTSFLKDSIEKDISQLEKRIFEQISILQKDIESNNNNLNNKIDTVEAKVEGKLDGVDESLRGNGRIGLFEQMRNTRWKFKAILLCLILLFGFRVFGRTLEDIYTTWFEKTPAPVVKVKPEPKVIIKREHNKRHNREEKDHNIYHAGEGKDPKNSARVIEESSDNKNNTGTENVPKIHQAP